METVAESGPSDVVGGLIGGRTPRFRGCQVKIVAPTSPGKFCT